MNPALEQDEIHLTVPAEPVFSRVARQAAGGAAARLDFSYDRLDEVRLAVAEAWSVLVGADERPGTVTMTLTVLGPGELAVVLTLDATADADADAGSAPGRADERATGHHERAVAVLGRVADEVVVEPTLVRLVLRAR